MANELANEQAPPKGIGGWLILVVIGLVLSPLRIGHTLATIHWPIFRDGAWEQLTTPGTAAYHAYWAPFIVFEILGNLVSAVLGLITLVLLVRKSRHTPRMAIAWLGWAAAFMLADFFGADLIPAVAAEPDPEGLKELLRSLVAAAIWIPYFLVSRRVKATFVE